jgi:hypothetical protein
MPENIRITSDENLIAFVKNIARTYGEMGLLSRRLTAQVAVMTNNIDAVNRIISRVGQLDPDSKKLFGNYFVGENLENLDMATRAPAILAAAYEYISEHKNDSDEMRNRFERIGAHIDTLSGDFANTGGMVVNNDEWPLVDINNIADAYEGLLHTFAARRADVERAGDTEKVAEYNGNLDQLQTVIAEYDLRWGLSNLHPEHASKIEDRWDDLWDTVNRAEFTPELKENLHKWEFTDSKGRKIPQFKKNGRLDKSGRLAAILDLARHDVAKKHVARVKEKIDEDELATELNEEIEFKLYNLAVADKIVNDASANPDQFDNPEFREQMMADLSRDGAVISDAGYNAQVDADVNATAGWAARIKSKLGTAAENVGGFFGNIFRPIKRVDRLANVRTTGGAADRRTARIEFFKRILKGFASAFIASALITTIATAAAATAGISLAASMAAIGMVTAIGMGIVQISRWRKAQKKAGNPTDIHAFLSDKRLVASLGVSAIAVVAMCFGAAGMATAATSLGYGALALGGAKNTVETYRDARRTKMSVAESLAWAIANAGAVIAGGFTGRMAANAGINYYNEQNPENRLFQNAQDRVIEHETEHTETRTEYTQDALDNAERIAKMWYRNNPDVLQQRVDAINAYNAEHGTNIDPYRAVMINADAGGQTFDNMRLHVNNSHIDPNINDIYSHGHHRVLTDAWGRAYDFSPDELRAAAHLFNADGSINPDGMDVISRLDNYVGETNTVGYMPGRGVHTDNYLNQNDVARGGEVSSNGRVYSTYTDGNPAMVENTYTTTETTYENVTDYNRANGDGMATFGNYNQRTNGRVGLRDRVGALVNRVRQGQQREEDVEQQSDTGTDADVLSRVPVQQPEVPVRQEKAEKPVVQEKAGLPVHQEKAELPVLREETAIVPVSDVDEHQEKIFAITRAQGKAWKDLHTNMTRVLNKMKKPGLGSRKMHELDIQRKDILHDIEQLRNDLGHESDEVINLAADQAIWRENLKQKQIELENIMQKRPAPEKGKYARVDWELNVAKAENSIADLLAKLGDAADESRLYYPTPIPGVQAQKKAARRAEIAIKPETHKSRIPEEIIEDAQVVSDDDNKNPFEINFDLPKYEPPYENPGDIDLDVRNHRVPKLDLGQFLKSKRDDIRDDEIRVIGGENKSVPDTQQKTDTDVPAGRFINEKPRHNERGGLVAVLRKAYDKLKKHVTGRTYRVPESLINIAENANLVSKQITDIRGIPVHLVDLSGNNNPFTQNENRVIVVVDVKGLRLPFYLANGDEGRHAGHWFLLPEIYRSGKWMRWVFQENASSEIPEVGDIANALDNAIGDIRNYQDDNLTAEYKMLGKSGFVGGNDVIEHIDSDKVFKIITKAQYQDSRNRAIFGAYDEGNRLSAELGWLRDYMASLESPEYKKSDTNFLRRWLRRGGNDDSAR